MSRELREQIVEILTDGSPLPMPPHLEPEVNKLVELCESNLHAFYNKLKSRLPEQMELDKSTSNEDRNDREMYNQGLEAVVGELEATAEEYGIKEQL